MATLIQGQHVIAETRRLSAIELGIRPGFGDRSQTEIKHPVASEITYLAQNKPIRGPPASGKKRRLRRFSGIAFSFYNHVLPL
jgi:hypothetical protein